MIKYTLLTVILLSGALFTPQASSATPTRIGMHAKFKYQINDLHRRTSDWFWRLGIEDAFYRTTGGNADYDEIFLRKHGNYYISSNSHYYARSYRRGRPEKDPMYDLDLAEARKVLAEPSLVGYGLFSMLQESDYFGTYESDQPHHVFAAKIHEDTVNIGIVDGLRSDSAPKYKSLNQLSSEWITKMIKADIGRNKKSLYSTTLGIPPKLDWQLNRHVRGRKDRASLGNYHPERPLPAYAGAFIVGAEIGRESMDVTHIGNGRLLLVRDDNIIWQTIDDNITYHLTTGMSYTEDPNFRAIRLPQHMNINDLAGVVNRHKVDIQSGDRIILASDSVWAVCSSEEILNWTRGLDNDEATLHAREQIKDKIAARNQKALKEGSKVYDQKFSIIIYDHIL